MQAPTPAVVRPRATRLIPPLPPSVGAAARATALLAALALVPDAALAAAGHWWTLPRPAVNLDYAWLVLAFPWLGAWGTSATVAIVFLLDVVLASGARFHGDAGTVLAAAGDAVHLPWVRLVPIAAGALGLGALGALGARGLLRRVPRHLGPHALAAGLVLLGVAPLVAPGTDPVRGARAVVLGDALPMAVVRWAAGTVENRGIAVPTVPSATAPLFAALDAGRPLPPRIVLVVLESFGSAPGLDSLVLAPLGTPAMRARYDVRAAAVPFEGPTVYGELRELCHARPGSVDLDPALLPRTSCLPARLAARGYRTAALHGYQGAMFHRRAWWPALGFGRMAFREDLAPDATGASGASDAPARRCGTLFEGLCDDDVWRTLAAELHRADGPAFWYWLTLTAHTPAPAPDPARARFACAVHPATRRSADVCRTTQLTDIVVRGVAATALEDGIDSTLFVLVGDHAPPFPAAADAAAFSTAAVPAVLLWPRDWTAAHPAPDRARR